MVKPGRERETKEERKKREREKVSGLLYGKVEGISISRLVQRYDVSTRKEERKKTVKKNFDSIDGNERVSRNQHSSGRKEKFTPQNHRAFLFLDDRKRKEPRERERERRRERERGIERSARREKGIERSRY